MTDVLIYQQTSSAFDQLIKRIIEHWQDTRFPQQPYDPQWVSPCQKEIDENGLVAWQPELREHPLDLSATEDALDLCFHPSLSVFYGRYYSETIDVTFTNNQSFAFVQVWNDDDGLRLQENIIAHILMQRKLKQTETVFIATTEDDFKVVSMINHSGEIVLETLGKDQRQHLSDNLAEFLSQLQPA
ncbi:SecY-interacting protein [Celerinatantimonas yamalensis]|uniref:SecY-interacting protein n=1 Tax=Celerinatantimonas yamalensis TaxID=559956 RepID=A0ABW9G9W3_9GAMM